jgi:hypothetical protein
MLLYLSTLDVLLVWETYEHHKKLMEREDYGQLLQDLKPVASGPLEVQHVEFNKDPTAVFTSPVAEFATLKVKPGISQEAFLLALEALAEAVVKAPACHSVVFGETREHRGVWVALLGWDSLEVGFSRMLNNGILTSLQAHREAAKNSDVGLQKLAGDLVAVSEMVVGHTNLVKFSG